MAWSSNQKFLAVKACRAAGITEEQRTDMILRNFEHATYKGDITSTSPRLTNHDYEQFMAIVEKFAGGKLLHFTQDYWAKHAADRHARMRGRVLAIAHTLEAHGKLHPDGVGLAGWIQHRVSGGATRDINDLDYHGLLALMLGLESHAHRSGLPLKG